MRFSIVTVALNPGEKLQKTLDSVFCQTCGDYEIILKDGGSTDGSMDRWKVPAAAGVDSHVRFYDEPDKGIYDAMNQAVRHAKGDFALFLNCGDVLADETVLERVARFIDREPERGDSFRPCSDEAGKADGGSGERLVIYGDTFSSKTKAVIVSAPQITGFTCYRNIPCHQSCFYSIDLCREKPYDLRYKIRADYDHFLWCRYRAGARFLHMDFAVSSYEGGGYSESRENMRRDKQEHSAIIREYMTGAELFRYRAVMALTLAPLRRKMADSKVFSGVYHRIKQMMYAGRR